MDATLKRSFARKDRDKSKRPCITHGLILPCQWDYPLKRPRSKKPASQEFAKLAQPVTSAASVEYSMREGLYTADQVQAMLRSVFQNSSSDCPLCKNSSKPKVVPSYIS